MERSSLGSRSRSWFCLAAATVALLLGGAAVAAAQSFTDTGVAVPGGYLGTGSWGDYDSDGDLDILVSGYGASAYVTNVYRNSDGAFADAGAGMTGVFEGSAAWGDYDADGDLDVVLSGFYGATDTSKVYRNNGSGAFTDIAAGLTAALGGTSVAWGDYDDDGDLDILLTGYRNGVGRIAKVYRNDGAGVFMDVGAALAAVSASSVAWGDYDNDGDLDVLLTGSNGSGGIARVYRNTNGAFADSGAVLHGVYQSSVAWGDYDNDGDLDILLTGRDTSATVAKVYQYTGGVFTDVEASLTGVRSGSVAWGDYDNDGDLDILLTGATTTSDTDPLPVAKVYRNDAGVFMDIEAGLTGPRGGTVAWGDYDNDGDLDFLLGGLRPTAAFTYVTKVYRNNLVTPNTVPIAPTNLTATVEGYQVTLSWDAASDAQTPASGLTYNIRLGTSSGAGDVVPPMAAAGGYRRLAALGNAQHGTTAMVRWLPPGTYHWSVQAVDAAWAGSPFANQGSFVVEPCVYSIDPVSVTSPVGGSSGGITVTTTASCPWTAVSNDAWITVTAGGSGVDDGTVSYSVDANPAGPRTGTITIANRTFTVSQAGNACSYAIDPTSVGFDWPGGTGAVTVTAGSWCDWTAVSNAPTWLAVTSGSPGAGNGSVGYSVAANPSGPRVGTITIGDETLTVTQVPHSIRELAHGSDAWQSLAALGGIAHTDYYRLAQQPYSSYEAVVEGASGDVQPVQIDRLASDDTTVLPPAAVAIGVGAGRSLRWRNNLSDAVTSESIRVRSGGSCGTDCGADDTYRIRFYDATAAIPRFSNAGTQVTVLVLQNPADGAVAGTAYFWSGAGALLASVDVTLEGKRTFVLNTSTLPALAGKSGAITIVHDAGYGGLMGKAVALEPSTGFSFDSPMMWKPIR